MIHESLSPIKFNDLRFGDWITLLFFPACLLIPGGGEAISLITCLYGVFLIMVRKARWNHLYNSEKQIILLFLAWFLIKAISISWSIDTHHSINKLGTSLHFFLAFPVLLAIRETAYEKSRLIILSARFTLIAVGIFGLIALLMGKVSPNPNMRFEAFAQNPLIFSTIISVMLLWVLEKFSYKPRLIDFISLLLGYVALYISFSRSSLIIMMICPLLIIALYAITDNRYRKTLGTLFILIILVISYVGFSLYGTDQGFEHIPNSINNYFTNPSPSGSSIEFRLDMWTASMNAYFKKPLLGYGVGNAYSAASPFFHYEAPKAFSHVHHMWFQIALELGTLGIVFTIFWVLMLLRLAQKNRHNELKWGLMLSLLIAYLLNGLTNIVFDQGLLNSFFVVSALILISREVKYSTIPKL